MDKTLETPAPADSRRHQPPRRPRLLGGARVLLRNSPGLIYLTWVGGTAVAVVHSMITWDQPDADLAGVVPLLQTLPWSLMAGFSPYLPSPLDLVVFVTVLIAGAVANAVILNWLTRSAFGLVRRTIRH